MQALAKVERGHDQDLGDVADLLKRGLVAAEDLWKVFEETKPLFLRYPAIEVK
jgi:hypothetical protein